MGRGSPRCGSTMAGPRRRVHRRGPADRGSASASAAGAGPGPGQRRRWQRPRRGRRDQEPAGAVRQGVRGDGKPDADFYKRWPNRPNCRTASMPPVRGISTGSWRSPWTPCGSRRATPGAATLGRRAPASRACAACCYRSPISSFWTSRRTISTPNRWPGSSEHCRNTRVPSSPSPTTATSSTTWRSGSWSHRASEIPWEGNYSSWLEQKQNPTGGRGEGRSGPSTHAGT